MITSARADKVHNVDNVERR